MKKTARLIIALLFACSGVFAQDTLHKKKLIPEMPYQPSFVRHTTIVSLGIGFVDYYKNNYTLPDGFLKGTTSGFAPVYGKVEYAISSTISLAAVFSYDQFYVNFYQYYDANGVHNAFKRAKTDQMRIFSGGAQLNYHFPKLLNVANLDPYAGIGLTLNNIHHTGLPQGDSLVTNTAHEVSPIVKVGARYYITPMGSFFAEAGWDKQSVVCVGFACRFFGKGK
jgi:hypothetical protein